MNIVINKHYKIYVANNELFDKPQHAYSDEDFKSLAYECYNIPDFVEAFNTDEIYSPTDFIRIIETNIED